MATELMTFNELESVMAQVETEANKASQKYLTEKLGGRDQFPCCFAWVDITGYMGSKITGNTRMGKLLKQAGVDQSYERKFQLWMPGRFGAQNVDVAVAGCEAAAKVLEDAGFETSVGSRWD
jgi:hypothetical protein